MQTISTLMEAIRKTKMQTDNTQIPNTLTEAIITAIDEIIHRGTISARDLEFVERVFDGPFILSDGSVIDVDSTHIPTTTTPHLDDAIKYAVKIYVDSKFDDGASSVTMKQIQSAIKIKGITCGMLMRICYSLGHDIHAGNRDYCYSTYYIPYD